MPPKNIKVAAKGNRPVTRSTAGSVATSSHVGSPPPEPLPQPTIQQPPSILESPYPPPPISQQPQPQFTQPPQAYIHPELASLRMSIGAMPITPGDRTVRIQMDVRRSPAYSAPQLMDPYSPRNLDDQGDQGQEQDDDSEEERNAVEYEVSRIQGGSNTSKQAVFNLRNRGISPRHPKHETRDLDHVFELLDKFLTLKPVPGRVERYHLDAKEWARIHKELTDIYLSRKHLEPSASIPLPPPWPGRFRTNGEDDVGEYDYIQVEELCILYRHLVETWLAQVWEQTPLTKERRIEKLPDKYRLKWKKLFADKSTVADEFKEIFGSEYEDRVEEDTIARLTVTNPERPFMSEKQLDERLDYRDSESELDPRARRERGQDRTINESRRYQEPVTFTLPHVPSNLVHTPYRTIPDHLGDRQRGRTLTEMFAPSQYAQGTSTVQRPATYAPTQMRRMNAGGRYGNGPPPGQPHDSSSDSSDAGRPPRRSGNGGGPPNRPPNQLPNFPPNRTPRAFVPPPGPPPP
ncbi:hypothetical protein M407DRAFT_28010 [Tulasnella calospora MUT 4182]|uniref:Uncharacterized protein n=1 Tax=Tulasnella calospora MUT 4182 TaxID=1051891 RepID=A0A0C3QCS4_9AGAM|nr:hypothetical protein M407DRAFT_28010 [Tulasnella calospora MUT 4182]